MCCFLLRRIFGGGRSSNNYRIKIRRPNPKIPGMRAQWKQLEAAPYDTLMGCQCGRCYWSGMANGDTKQARAAAADKNEVQVAPGGFLETWV